MTLEDKALLEKLMKPVSFCIDEDLRRALEVAITGGATIDDLRKVIIINSFDEYVKKLIDGGLIEVNGNKVNITEIGKGLLDKIKSVQTN